MLTTIHAPPAQAGRTTIDRKDELLNGANSAAIEKTRHRDPRGAPTEETATC